MKIVTCKLFVDKLFTLGVFVLGRARLVAVVLGNCAGHGLAAPDLAKLRRVVQKRRHRAAVADQVSRNHRVIGAVNWNV